MGSGEDREGSARHKRVYGRPDRQGWLHPDNPTGEGRCLLEASPGRDRASQTRRTKARPGGGEVSSPYREATEEMVERVHRALAKTRNNSIPGPDRINYRHLKLIKDTPLERQSDTTSR